MSCKYIVKPLAKDAEPYQCTKKEAKDGWCTIHHPDYIAAKVAEVEFRKQSRYRRRLCSDDCRLTQNQLHTIAMESNNTLHAVLMAQDFIIKNLDAELAKL